MNEALFLRCMAWQKPSLFSGVQQSSQKANYVWDPEFRGPKMSGFVVFRKVLSPNHHSKIKTDILMF